MTFIRKFSITNILLFASLFLTVESCGPKSDEEYLKAEQKELQEKLESNQVLFYKLFKIVFRTQAAGKTANIPNASHLYKVSDQILSLTDTTQKQQITVSFEDMMLAYKEYAELQDFALKTDEDLYPTLLETFYQIQLPQTQSIGATNYASMFGWNNNLEHGFLGSLQTSARRTELALYETSRINTTQEKNPERRCLYRMQRGLVWTTENFPYLSEQELTQNQQWLDTEGKSYSYTFLASVLPTGTNDQVYQYVHGLNLICRGLARIKMERDDKKDLALQDFEAFLADANSIGLNNELVWLIATYVALERKDNETALKNLRLLEKSPIFSEEDHKMIQAGIAYLEAKNKGDAFALVSEKAFMSKLAVQYFISQLKKVDWKKHVGSRPEVKTMIHYNEALQQQLQKVENTASLDNLKKEGSGLLDKAKKAVQ
jgi:hypothetical protein